MCEHVLPNVTSLASPVASDETKEEEKKDKEKDPEKEGVKLEMLKLVAEMAANCGDLEQEPHIENLFTTLVVGRWFIYEQCCVLCWCFFQCVCCSLNTETCCRDDSQLWWPTTGTTHRELVYNISGRWMVYNLTWCVLCCCLFMCVCSLLNAETCCLDGSQHATTHRELAHNTSGRWMVYRKTCFVLLRLCVSVIH